MLNTTTFTHKFYNLAAINRLNKIELTIIIKNGADQHTNTLIQLLYNTNIINTLTNKLTNTFIL